MKNVGIIFLIWMSSQLANCQSLDFENQIYTFICSETHFKKFIDCEKLSESDLKVLISIRKLHDLNIEKSQVSVFLFRAGFSPSRVYLLISRNEQIFIIGQEGKEMFSEMRGLYEFLEFEEEEKVKFLRLISDDMFFIYENNIEFKNSNRIMVNGKYI